MHMARDLDVTFNQYIKDVEASSLSGTNNEGEAYCY